jgi:hypothetical protein
MRCEALLAVASGGTGTARSVGHGLYLKQLEFHDAGAVLCERLVMLRTQVGKTPAGGMEAAMRAS